MCKQQHTMQAPPNSNHPALFPPLYMDEAARSHTNRDGPLLLCWKTPEW